MASNSKMEIEKFNGKSFELWKLKMEYLLVDRDQWIAVDLGMTPTGTSADDWKKTGSEGKEHNSTVSLRFSITKCVRGSYIQRFMGKVGEVVSV
jgi:hypothetical protein